LRFQVRDTRCCNDRSDIIPQHMNFFERLEQAHLENFCDERVRALVSCSITKPFLFIFDLFPFSKLTIPAFSSSFSPSITKPVSFSLSYQQSYQNRSQIIIKP